MVYVAGIVLAAGLVLQGVYVLGGALDDPRTIAPAVAAALVAGLVTWRRFVATAEGLELHRIGRRRFVSWSDMGSIDGRDAGTDVVSWRYATYQAGASAHKAIVNLVFDHEGRPVFRIGTLIHDRRGLAALVRAHLAHARDARGTP